MKPLVCFYKNESYFFSEEYTLLNCPDHVSITDFLSQIEKEYFSFFKIIQINFEAQNEKIFLCQKALYPLAKANVFILKNYKILSLDYICKNLQTDFVDKEIQFESLTTHAEFTNKVNFIIEQIKNGRIYQANLTSPLKAICELSSSDLFNKFQKKFDGEYQALLPLNEVEVISFSPELFLKQEDGLLITRPIKGTASVAKNFSSDLIENTKENAELSMIVDLLRNDLNSLSDTESSQVSKHREQMLLGYLQHTYSEITIECRLPLSEVIDKTFPGGSISGCPKKESLLVISEVEKFKRQAYTGTNGWWRENNFCLSIAIRSFIKSSQELYYHAGCGIVYDSIPELEWQEFLLKTGTLNVESLD